LPGADRGLLANLSLAGLRPPATRHFADLPFRRQATRPGGACAGLWHQDSEGQTFRAGFSNRPNVLFALPAKDHRVKLGDTLEVKAVLVDSAFDLMIRRITDTTRKDSQSGDLSLDPTVTITRANGEKVAEASCLWLRRHVRYSWRVPKDLKLTAMKRPSPCGALRHAGTLRKSERQPVRHRLPRIANRSLHSAARR